MQWCTAMVMFAAVSAGGCFLAPPEAPLIAPTSASTPAAPARITLSALAGIGNGTGLAFITARVLDANGRGVPYATVTLTTSSGVIAPTVGNADKATGPTTTGTADASGLLQGTVKAPRGSTTVTAASGSVSSSITVDIVGP